MKVILTDTAKESLGKYYERYSYLPTGGTDLEQRSDYYRKIVRMLSCINQYTGQTYKRDDINYIRITDIATVEYQIENGDIISIKNIYFNNRYY
jgi:hypothetical protein